MKFSILFPHLRPWVLGLAHVWPATIIKPNFAIWEVFHILSLVLLGGGAILVGLRLAGAGLKDEPPSAVYRGLAAILVTGVVGVVVTGLLIGMAVHDGRILSLDDNVSAYVPELADREAGHTTLRALLQMSSGLDFHEVYNGHDDIMRLGRALMRPDGGTATEVVQAFNTRVAPPGARFNYSGLDTELLGLVLTRVTGKSLSELVKTRIWDPIGAESDASWIIDSHGQEVAYCCFNAVLRDWGRLGALLAQDGMWDGKQVIPKEWLVASTSQPAPSQAAGVNGHKLGYGYQVWLLPSDRRQFALIGIYGQTILIDPVRHVVLVQTAVLPRATDPIARQELLTLWQALVARTDAQ